MADKWDVAHLIQIVDKHLNGGNFRVLGRRFEDMVGCKPKTGEDLFTFIARLIESVAQVKRLESLATEVGEKLEIPNWLIVLKILLALDHFVKNLLLQKKGSN